ncbi:MAG: MFS transporter [Deltaproteobacteria bacterium]|nr:MFS transporter [Deltaproteobacteria bacterium]
MQPNFFKFWPLFFGAALTGLCVIFQHTLVGVRALHENFDTVTTGIVMAAYFVGYLIGSVNGPRIIRRVGHIRTFGAFASIGSAAVLLYPIYINAWMWGFVRLLFGMAISIIWIVVESWLHQQTSNANRAKLMAFYSVLLLAAFCGGPLLLNIAEPTSSELFILASLLMSLVRVPLLLSGASAAPLHEASNEISLRKLFRLAPLGVIGIPLVECCAGVIYGMGAVYALETGLTTKEATIFVAALSFGGILFQYPIGVLSDRMDRRLAIGLISVAATISGIAALAVVPTFNTLLALAVLFGGFCLPIHALLSAHINDYLDATQMVAANAAVVLLVGIGAIFGPALVGILMKLTGPSAFFWFPGLSCGLIALYTVWRMFQRAPVPSDERSEFEMRTPAGSAPNLKSVPMGIDQGD